MHLIAYNTLSFMRPPMGPNPQPKGRKIDLPQHQFHRDQAEKDYCVYNRDRIESVDEGRDDNDWEGNQVEER